MPILIWSLLMLGVVLGLIDSWAWRRAGWRSGAGLHGWFLIGGDGFDPGQVGAGMAMMVANAATIRLAQGH